MARDLKSRIGAALTDAGLMGQQAHRYRQMSEKSAPEKACVASGGTWLNGVCIPRRNQDQSGGDTSVEASPGPISRPVRRRPYDYRRT